MPPRRSETDHPFYRPLWRRVLLVAFVALWFAYELLVSGDRMWQVFAGGMLAYAAWFFLIRYRPPAEDPVAAPLTDKEP